MQPILLIFVLTTHTDSNNDLYYEEDINLTNVPFPFKWVNGTNILRSESR